MFLPTRWILLATTLLLSNTLGVFAGDDESAATTKVEFDVNLAHGKTGSFIIEVHPDWAPLGVQRFLELVELGDDFWKGVRFFRVIENFVAQFGIPGKPALAEQWIENTIDDDKAVKSNKRGYITFAGTGENSRTSQMFINLADNQNLDEKGFAPFGKVIDGMEVVDQLYSGYGEGALPAKKSFHSGTLDPSGKGPKQGRILAEGNKYLKKQFPNLSYVKSVRIVGESEKVEIQ